MALMNHEISQCEVQHKNTVLCSLQINVYFLLRELGCTGESELVSTVRLFEEALVSWDKRPAPCGFMEFLPTEAKDDVHTQTSSYEAELQRDGIQLVHLCVKILHEAMEGKVAFTLYCRLQIIKQKNKPH